jgi:hypothetical protein
MPVHQKKFNPTELVAEEVLLNPDFFLLAIDLERRTAMFLRFTRQSYRALAFLDDRAIPNSNSIYLVDLEELLELYRAHSVSLKAPKFVFHPGFSCSTLLARCLDMIDGCFVLKEPFVLHQIAAYRNAAERGDVLAQGWDKILELAIFFLSRTYRPSDRAVIKSDCHLLMDCLGQSDGALAVWLFPSLSRFILAVLKVPVRRAWARSRLSDSILLHRRLGDRFGLLNILRVKETALTDAECAASFWLLQMCLFAENFGRCESKAILISSEEFLDHPLEAISLISSHFGLRAEKVEIAKIMDGDAMRFHSKNTTKRFDRDSLNAQFEYLSQVYRDELRGALESMQVILDGLILTKPLADEIQRSLERGIPSDTIPRTASVRAN